MGLEVRQIATGVGGVGSIVAGGFANAGVTQGDGDLRIFGTYAIKQM
jgi:hypothetical protein